MVFLGFCRFVKLLGRSAQHPRPLLGISFPSTGRHTSTDSKNKFYELRIYSIQPSKFGEFIKLTNENLHLRLAHSRLIGYWTTELGGLNEVVHLWEYGKLIEYIVEKFQIINFWPMLLPLDIRWSIQSR